MLYPDEVLIDKKVNTIGNVQSREQVFPTNYFFEISCCFPVYTFFSICLTLLLVNKVINNIQSFIFSGHNRIVMLFSSLHNPF